MMEFSSIVCPNCGQKAVRTVNGHSEHMKCDSCGWSQDATVFHTEELPFTDDNSRRVEVYIKWMNEQATPKEVMAARRAFEGFSQRPLQDVA